MLSRSSGAESIARARGPLEFSPSPPPAVAPVSPGTSNGARKIEYILQTAVIIVNASN